MIPTARLKLNQKKRKRERIDAPLAFILRASSIQYDKAGNIEHPVWGIYGFNILLRHLQRVGEGEAEEAIL